MVNNIVVRKNKNFFRTDDFFSWKKHDFIYYFSIFFLSLHHET
jgi:hypothetical protein